MVKNFTVTLFNWDYLILIWFDSLKKQVEIHDRHVIYGEFNILKKHGTVDTSFNL